MPVVNREFGHATKGFFGLLRRITNASAADTLLTLPTLIGVPLRIYLATVRYSAVPVQAGVTFTLNSGQGAAWDTILSTGAANAQDNSFQPSEPLYIADDDTFDVTAPAAGGAITSQIAIYVGVL